MIERPRDAGTSSAPKPHIAMASRLPMLALVVLMIVGLTPNSLASQERGRAVTADSDTMRLSMGEAIRIALERSPSLRRSEWSTVLAELRAREQRSSLLPQVSLDALHSARTFNTASFGLDFPSAPGQEPFFDPDGEVVGPVRTVDFRGHLSQTLFDWSAVTRVREAHASVDASSAQTDVVRNGVAGEAALRYVAAVRAGNRLEARTADVSLAEELLEEARALLSSGVGVRLDVTRAEAQLAAMEAELVSARSEARRTRLALLDALSLPLDAPVNLSPAPLDARNVGSPGEAPGPEDVEARVAAALERRADLRELELRTEAAHLGEAAVRAERLPRVSLVAADGITGDEYSRLLNTYEWGVRVSLPIFDGARRGARREEESVRVAQLEERRRELEQEVAFSVRDALLQLEAARQLVVATDARLDLAEAEVSQARQRLDAGVAGTADVANASMRLNEARTAAADARASLESARVSLAIAEGTVEELP